MDNKGMRNNYTCAICHYSWLSSKLPKRCSNPGCRSMKWNNQSIIPMADLPAEKKSAEASPEVKKEPYTFTELVEKRLHPERTDEERKEQIEALKALTNKEKYKKESILPSWPTTPTNSFDEYGPVIDI